jgi:glutamate receptor 3
MRRDEAQISWTTSGNVLNQNSQNNSSLNNDAAYVALTRKFSITLLRLLQKIPISIRCLFENLLMLVFFSLIDFLQLQELYQQIKPGINNILIEMVRCVENSREAIQFLQTLESIRRYGRKFVVLDCRTSLASEIVVIHVIEDVHLGRRNYHYLLSGLVRETRLFVMHTFMITTWLNLCGLQDNGNKMNVGEVRIASLFTLDGRWHKTDMTELFISECVHFLRRFSPKYSVPYDLNSTLR